MAQEFIGLAAVLALGGAWGGLVGHYGRVAHALYQRRTGRDARR